MPNVPGLPPDESKEKCGPLSENSSGGYAGSDKDLRDSMGDVHFFPQFSTLTPFPSTLKSKPSIGPCSEYGNPGLLLNLFLGCGSTIGGIFDITGMVLR